MRERVAAHDRLVGLGPDPGGRGEELARPGELLGSDAGRHAERLATHAQRHHELLERGVARALADAVDGDLDLARARLDRGQGVGDGQPEVVVAVAGEDDARHVADETRHEGPELFGQRVADGVGDVHHARPRLLHRLHDLAQERVLRPAAVLRRELDVGRDRAGQADGGRGLLDAFACGDVELVLEMDGGGGQEHVQARRARRPFQGAAGGRDVGLLGAAQRRHRRPADLLPDGPHGLELARRGDREAGLDDVHTQALELAGQDQLLRRVHAAARRLLAIPQRGVEHGNSPDGRLFVAHRKHPQKQKPPRSPSGVPVDLALPAARSQIPPWESAGPAAAAEQGPPYTHWPARSRPGGRGWSASFEWSNRNGQEKSCQEASACRVP